MHKQSIFVKWLEIVIMNAQRVTKKSESEAEYWLLLGYLKKKTSHLHQNLQRNLAKTHMILIIYYVMVLQDSF